MKKAWRPLVLFVVRPRGVLPSRRHRGVPGWSKRRPEYVGRRSVPKWRDLQLRRQDVREGDDVEMQRWVQYVLV